MIRDGGISGRLNKKNGARYDVASENRTAVVGCGQLRRSAVRPLLAHDRPRRGALSHRLPDPDQAPRMVLAQPEQVRLSHTPNLLQIDYHLLGPKHNEAKRLKSRELVHGDDEPSRKAMEPEG